MTGEVGQDTSAHGVGSRESLPGEAADELERSCCWTVRAVRAMRAELLAQASLPDESLSAGELDDSPDRVAVFLGTLVLMQLATQNNGNSSRGFSTDRHDGLPDNTGSDSSLCTRDHNEAVCAQRFEL